MGSLVNVSYAAVEERGILIKQQWLKGMECVVLK